MEDLVMTAGNLGTGPNKVGMLHCSPNAATPQNRRNSAAISFRDG
jgi:hypothetical protein